MKKYVIMFAALLVLLVAGLALSGVLDLKALRLTIFNSTSTTTSTTPRDLPISNTTQLVVLEKIKNTAISILRSLTLYLVTGSVFDIIIKTVVVGGLFLVAAYLVNVVRLLLILLAIYSFVVGFIGVLGA